MKDIKDKHLDELNTPNYMWVTFKNDSAVHAAREKKTFYFD